MMGCMRGHQSSEDTGGGPLDSVRLTVSLLLQNHFHNDTELHLLEL